MKTQKTIDDINKQITALYGIIVDLEEEKVLLIDIVPPTTNTWRDRCNLYNNDEIADEYGD